MEVAGLHLEGALAGMFNRAIQLQLSDPSPHKANNSYDGENETHTLLHLPVLQGGEGAEGEEPGTWEGWHTRSRYGHFGGHQGVRNGQNTSIPRQGPTPCFHEHISAPPHSLT